MKLRISQVPMDELLPSSALPPRLTIRSQTQPLTPKPQF